MNSACEEEAEIQSRESVFFNSHSARNMVWGIQCAMLTEDPVSRMEAIKIARADKQFLVPTTGKPLR
eukprot:6390687-Amphidinium_carterae.1